jgi:hypothetical protein
MGKKREVSMGLGSDTTAPEPTAPASPSFDPFFTCKNCGDSGEADEMFNLPCSPARTSRAKLAELIRCRRCAEDIARQNQRELGEPGCGVYFLRITLPLLRPESELAAETDKPKRPSAQEIRDRRDEETRAWVEAGLRRRAEESRKEAVRSYAMLFAEFAYDEEADVQVPIVRAEHDGSLSCGLPTSLSCCNHFEPTSQFLAFGGEVIGLCDFAAVTFLQVQQNHQDDDRYKKLLWFKERDRAEQAAAKWNARLGRKK